MANPTTYFAWVMPNSADLVTDLPADFAVFGQGVDTSMSQLLGGTTGQVLSKTSGTNMAFTWINNDTGDITGVTAGTGITGGGTSGTVTVTNDMATTITTNGDLIYGTGSGTYTRRAIGSTSQVLTVAGGIPTWATPSSGGMTLIQTTAFSAASSQSINSVFSSTFDNYRVVFSATAASALTMTMRMRVGGVDDSSANYTLQDLTANGTSLAASRTSGATSWSAVVIRTTLLTPMAFDIFNPFKTSTTVALVDTVDIGDPAIRSNLMIHAVNTSYDGFDMICSTSNMTGSVSIYGYNK